MAIIINGKSVGVTPQGFVLPQLSDLKSDIEDTIKSVFGAGVNLQPESNFGQIVGIWADGLSKVWQGQQGNYQAMDPNQATGASLDLIGAIRGIPRLSAKASSIQNVKLFGTAGTVVPMTTTKFNPVGAPTSLFSLNTTVTLVAGASCIQTITFTGGVPASGSFILVINGSQVSINWNDTAGQIQTKIRTLTFCSACTSTGTPVSGLITITFNGAGTGGFMVQPVFAVTTNTLLTAGSSAVTPTPAITQAGVDQANVSVKADATGPTIANAGTLTVIATPVSGLTGVLNVQDAIVGMDVESDNAYRARMDLELQIAGAGTVEAIRSRLLQVDGVTSAIVFENPFKVVDANGLPPSSFQAFVKGGTDEDIANTLWASKPAGIETFGNIAFTITDSQGLQHIMNFSRPTQVPIYVTANIEVGLDYPVDGDQSVKQALVDFINALGQGADLIVVPKLISSIANIAGIDDAELLVGITAGPTLPNNIPISIQEIAVGDTSRVIVNHV